MSHDDETSCSVVSRSTLPCSRNVAARLDISGAFCEVPIRQMSRYGQLYVDRGKPKTDSDCFRKCLATYLAALGPGRTHLGDELQMLRLKLGIDIGASGGVSLAELFLNAELRDVLDSITLLHSRDRPEAHVFGTRWLALVAEVFAEEHMAYRLDDRGGVHPFVDAEFQANQTAALEALSQTRFGEARTDFETAFRHLRSGEGKSAIRSMFPAVEVAAKVLFPGALSRLMPNDLDKLIKPRIQARYIGNEPAIDAALQLLGGFRQWIIASQPYRHGQEVQEPVEPPHDFLVAHLSTGAAFLRWMIEVAG